MRAAVLTELGKPLELMDLYVPPLSVGQVLVRVHASGICGAQMGEIAGAKGKDPYLPHLLGHEGGGVVLDIGPGVTTVKPKDHVVLHWRKGTGIEAAPPKYPWEGGTVGGGWITTFNDHAVISENRMTKIPKEIPFEIAALMGCAVTTALGLINNEAKLRIGESIAVAGCGGVGLNIIQGAALVGGNPILALDWCLPKLKMAVNVGATRIFSNMQKLSSEPPVDVFVDCTGDPGVIEAGYNMVKLGGGRMILLGQPDYDDALILPGFRKHYCGKTIMDSQGGLTNPTEDIPRYLRLYQFGKLPLEQFITHRFPLEQVNKALSVVRDGLAGRVILTME